MKIAVPSTHPDLDGAIAHKLGTAPYLLVIETDDLSFDVVEGISSSYGPGAGVEAVSLVLDKGAKGLLVGSVSPHIARALRERGIDVVTDCSGPVAEVVAAYTASGTPAAEAATTGSGDGETSRSGPDSWGDVFRRSGRQFYALVPRLVGVVLLLGLFRGFLPQEKLLSLFSGSPLYDAVCGAALGSVLAGNPVNSYVIGDSLLRAGAGLAGGSALMLAWVSVGIIQLPAESAALGIRFALVRNAAGFCMAVFMALVLAGLAGGGA